ncbi:MAG: thioredoxin [Planctomycetota bacterium]
MASEAVVEFTDANFQSEVLESDTPVVVDFWAEWCMPCRMLAPTIDELADDYAGKVKVGKVDTDANREVAAQMSISAIPTVMVFKGGEMVKQFVGVTQKQEFVEELAKHTD